MAEANKWVSGQTIDVCFGVDARLLSKGNKGVAPQTMVCIAERGEHVSLKALDVYRIALLWGKENRQLLRRNLQTTIKFLDSLKDGKTTLEMDGEVLTFEFFFCSDLAASDQVFPNDGCLFCDWVKGSKLSNIKDPNKVPTGALFNIPKKI
jgi:hypothetical protein